MLVLSRKPPVKGAQPTARQQIVVNGPAVITILDVQGNNVSVGVEADPSVSIRRGEVGDVPGEGANESESLE